ncbi:uncharacterized protein DAT39_004002, partial [Clarias magur]
ILFNSTWAWSVDMPSSISGLHRSCLVIPCEFSYSSNPPYNPYRIVWYQHVSRGYPLVFDSWNPYSVIEKYRGKTSLYEGLHKYRDCSLLIKDLRDFHHGDRIYAWIDPENVGWTTYKFYDVSTFIRVRSSAPKPEVDIYGGYKIGERIRVQCITYHTCPYNPPSLSLSGIQKTFDSLDNIDIGGGNWKITLTRHGVVESERQRVECSVRHSGGLSASTTKIHYAECSIDEAQISPDSNTEFLEGVEQDIVCSVTYMCSSAQPQISWKNGIFNGINTYISKQGIKYEVRSTLKFTAKADDHGKTVTCQTDFKGMVQRVQITLRVKKMFSLDWTYSMPSKMTGLRGTCLVIPCSFDFRNSTKNPADVEVKWYIYSTSQYPLVYSSDGDYVIGKYFGKTKLYGQTSEKDCSLEIKTEMNHNGDRLYPWMDPKSIETFHKEDFYAKSIELQITEQADKPKLSIIGVPRVGEQVTVSCSVFHTCPSNPPSLSVGKALETDISVHNPEQDGFWELTRIHTFIIKEEEQTVTCKATFHGGQISESQIYLKAQ